MKPLKMLRPVQPIFKKLYPLRPTVIRKVDTVKTCYYYEGTKDCLGTRCFWSQVGNCPIYNRIQTRLLKLKAK